MAMKKLPNIIAASVLGLSMAATVPIISSIVLPDGAAAHAYGTSPPAPGSGEGGKGGGGDASTGGSGSGSGSGDVGGQTGSGD